MAKTFTNQAEAIATLGPFFKAGKLGQYTVSNVFGKTYVKVWRGAGYFKLTEAEFAALVSA